MFSIEALTTYLGIEVFGEEEKDDETRGYCIVRNPTPEKYYQVELCFPVTQPFSEENGYYQLLSSLGDFWDGRLDRQKGQQLVELFHDLSFGRMMVYFYNQAEHPAFDQLYPYRVCLYNGDELLTNVIVMGGNEKDARCIALLDFLLRRSNEYSFHQLILIRDAIKAIHHEKNAFSQSVTFDGIVYADQNWMFTIEKASPEEQLTFWEL